jgi:hypothetical protein
MFSAFKITGLIVMLVMELLISSCERYEEDPWITFRKPIDRVKGKRRITEFTIDGRDTLSFFTNKWGNFYWDFTHDGLFGNMVIRVRNSETHEEIDHGDWNIYKSSGFAMNFSFYRNGFDIKKCTKKEIKLVNLHGYFNPDSNDTTFHHLTMILEQIK